MKRLPFNAIIFLSLILAATTWAAGPYQVRFPAPGVTLDPQAVTVIGSPQEYVIKKGDTLLDVARNYGLGYLELGNIYRQWDPFLPPAGERITIPTTWIIPDQAKYPIVVNTGNMRLYYFVNNNQQVYTFPIGMGVLDFKTPSGVFKIVEKKVNPAWHIPKSLQAKYGMATMPAGPDNPMGDYKLTLSWGDYGIHGTNIAWAIGRLCSHGCTRMYPEHIKKFFTMVKVGTAVEYIYEPVMIGFKNGRIFLEVNQDYYHKIPDLLQYTLNKLESRGVMADISLGRVLKVVEEQFGYPEDVSKTMDRMASSQP